MERSELVAGMKGVIHESVRRWQVDETNRVTLKNLFSLLLWGVGTPPPPHHHCVFKHATPNLDRVRFPVITQTEQHASWRTLA